MSDLLSGTTAECSRDFLSRYKWEEVQRLVAEFTKVERSTVRRWMAKDKLPIGEELIRLRVLLDLAGYTVSEFSTQHAVIQQLMRVIAFDLLTVEAIRVQLQYKNKQDIYRVVLRPNGLYPDRVYRLQRLVEESAEIIAQYVDEWRQKLEEFKRDNALDLLPSIPPPPLPARSSVRNDPVVPEEPVSAVVPRVVRLQSEVSEDYDTNVRTMSLMLETVSSLARSIDASPTADQQWRAIRQFAGETAIRRLIKFLEHSLD